MESNSGQYVEKSRLVGKIDIDKLYDEDIKSKSFALKLGEFFHDDELYRKYPELRELTVKFIDCSDPDGMYLYEHGGVNYNAEDKIMRISSCNSTSGIQSFIEYELQHSVIPDIEQARGGEKVSGT